MKTKLRFDWKEVTLGEVAEFINGRAFKPEEWENKGRIIIRIQDLTNSINSPNYTTKTFDKKYLVKKGDLLISWSATLDVFIWNKEDGWLNQHIFKVKEKKDILDKKFLYYLIKNRIEDFKKQTHGSTMKHITKDRFTAIKLHLPPLSTQQKIVSILEKVEKAKELRKEADELTKDFLKAVFLDMFGNPSKNPKQWEVVKFSKLGELARGKSKHRPRNDPKLLGGKYPLIQTGDVANSQGRITKFTQTYSELGLKQSKMWPKGTLCITIAAHIAKTGILTFDACFPDSIVGFTPNNYTNIEYIQHWLSFLQKTLEKNAPESAQKNINLEILENLNVPLPLITLQNKFSKLVKSVEFMKKYQEHSKENLENLFNILMQRAFKGELVC